jgi:WD40 repeat protein
MGDANQYNFIIVLTLCIADLCFAVMSVCVTADKLISGSEDRTIRIWSLATGVCEQTLTGHTDWGMHTATACQ